MKVKNMSGLSKADVFDVFAEVMKAVANGRRLELLELIAQNEHAVDELAHLTGSRSPKPLHTGRRVRSGTLSPRCIHSARGDQGPLHRDSFGFRSRAVLPGTTGKNLTKSHRVVA